MDNQELKIKFEENKNAIEKAKSLNQDISQLLKTKYDLLKIGFEKIKQGTSGDNFNQNPRKYSTLLSYINSMKKITEETNMSDNEVKLLENEVIEEMKKNNLNWLLNKTP